VVCPSAIYLAWQVELAAVTNCWEIHIIGLLYSLMSMPYVNLELGPPQLASAKHSTGCDAERSGNIFRTRSFVPAR
jgi:hypothetical protein